MPTVINGTTGINNISGGADVNGSLDFVSAGSRITADFSGAILADRTYFKTSVANGVTDVACLPDGTATTSTFTTFNNADPTNASLTQLLTDATKSTVRAVRVGSGTFLPLTLETNGTERMRISTAGNMGLGTVPSDSVSGQNRFLAIGDSDTGIGWVADGVLTLCSNNSERLRVLSTGQIVTGLTASTGSQLEARASSNGAAFRADGAYPAGEGCVYFGNRNNASFTAAVFQVNTSSTVGSITCTTSATAYNTSSDYRLKENIQDLTESGIFIDALIPRTWTWKSTGERGVGFVAHELQVVSPSSVTGAKDAVDEDGSPVYQLVEYGSAEVIAMLVAEVKSLRARIAALEAR